MMLKQEFLILDRGDGAFAVYRPSTFPKGTVIGRDARELRVLGPSRVDQPAQVLSEAELEQWRRDLAEAGNEVTIGPFRTSEIDYSQVDSSDLRKQSVPLKEAFDEILRRADARAEAEDRRIGPVGSRLPRGLEGTR